MRGRGVNTLFNVCLEADAAYRQRGMIGVDMRRRGLLVVIHSESEATFVKKLSLLSSPIWSTSRNAGSV